MSNIAKNIIEKFGGFYALATALNIEVSWVYRWTYPKERGGTGGLIPASHQQTILNKASAMGISLSPADFFEIQKTKPKNRRTN